MSLRFWRCNQTRLLASSGPLRCCASRAPFNIFWEDSAVQAGLPKASDPLWRDIGQEIVKSSIKQDMGQAALIECADARAQLETIVRGAGYEIDVHLFGGLTVMDMLEVGGDVDFCGVSEVEPEFEEASEIVSRLSREMRRLGLRASAVPRARIPVIKVDRTSFALPGTPLHTSARMAVFQMTQPMLSSEQEEFRQRLMEDWNAVTVTWVTPQMVNVVFETTTDVMAAVAGIRKHGAIEIPLRTPAEPKDGPELYRYPFDMVFNTTGLRNSAIFHDYLMMYPFSRHLLMAVKRWGRSSGVINTIDGLLASYAMTVMLVHYLVVAGAIPPLDIRGSLTVEPALLPKAPIYRPLETEGDLQTLGYLYGTFFHYFAHVFDYKSDVVCTTRASLQKTSLPMWTNSSVETGESSRPPWYYFAIKDPYNTDNIGRNLDEKAVTYVRSAFNLAHESVVADNKDPAFLVDSLSNGAPKPNVALTKFTYKPKRVQGPSQNDVDGDGEREEEANSDAASTPGSSEFEARRTLAKELFHQRKDEMRRFGQSSARQNEQVKAAQGITRSVVGWLKKGKISKDGSAPKL